jgi:hypothetical protein
MAATQQIVSPQARAPKHFAAHPLCPLTASEISNTAQLIKALWPSHADLLFKALTLEEPQKKHFVTYLDAEHAGRTLPRIDRKAFVAYYLRNTVRIGKCTGKGPSLSRFIGQISRSHCQSIHSDRRVKCPSRRKRAWQWRLCRDSHD